MIIILFIASAWAQNMYVNPAQGYAFSTQEAASEACVALDLQLCSAEQLFTVVYGAETYSNPQMCYTAWTSDATTYSKGWFNNDIETCALRVGWNTWDPDFGMWGAHCCDAAVPETSINHCGDFTCEDGSKSIDSASSVFCASGTCDAATCCVSWTPAEDYQIYPSRWGYLYSSGEDAEAACAESHEDFNLCTKEQLEAFADRGDFMCSSGWYKDGFEYKRGWWLAEEHVDSGDCPGGVAGENTWSQPDGTGTAHCCAPSYHKSYYGHLTADGFTNDFQGATQYCEAQTYTQVVCTEGQLETIAKTENDNICTSGFYRGDDTDEVGRIGWWQGIGTDQNGNEVCNGLTGLRTWASQTPVAHCCADYVMEPDLGVWTFTPAFYSGAYADGASAEAECLAVGYDQLCTKGQVAYIGTEIQTDLCIVGWSKDAGSYVYGYYQTTAGAGCGQQGTWNDEWFPGTAVAFCCMSTVEELTLTQPAYYNGNWDYSYTSQAAAAAQCTGDYSLCSKAQVYTIAEIGVELSDGETQTENNICRLGWVSDGEMGWWQADDSQCGGETGWRTFTSAGATYHCCLDFEATEIPSDGTDVPTSAPTATVFESFKQISTSYVYESEAEAKAACQSYNSGMTLCSAAQIVEVAINGAPASGDFIAVASQADLCHTAWVDTAQAVCEEPKDIGWFRVNEGCGSGGMTWETYHPVNPDRAGAFCCAAHVEITLEDPRNELGCAPETTTTTTEPVVSDYFDISDELCTALGVNDCSQVYTKDNEYFVRETGVYYSTCVAYSTVEDAACDFNSLVCAGVLRASYGSYVEQGVLLAQAMAEADYEHAQCPPSDQAAYSGYAPAGFEEKVSYSEVGDCYLMNGMETCVCNADYSDPAAELQNLWENNFYLTHCEAKRTFDEVMTDQLWITNEMIDDLESQIASIPDVNSQLASAESELQAIWNTWETEITATIEAAVSTAEADGNDELVTSLQNILTALDDLSD